MFVDTTTATLLANSTVMASDLYENTSGKPKKRNRGGQMKKIKSYSSIWSVEKVIYAINDLTLPFPVTFSQMAWFIGSLFLVMTLGHLPPLCFIEGAFLKYLGIPAFVTWFMSQKTLDGKKPLSFVKSMVQYFVRPKVTYAGKAVKPQKQVFAPQITYVRSDDYGLSN